MDPLDIEVLASRLSKLPDPTYWFAELRLIKAEYGDIVMDNVKFLAKRAWLMMVCESIRFPLHPKVKENFMSKNYFLDDEDNLLILATALALIKEKNIESRYNTTKNFIEKKYGLDSWKKVETAIYKISKILFEITTAHQSPVLEILTKNTLLFRTALIDETYSKLPKKV